jgi:phosphoribosylanthranilate isomerase
VRQTVRLDAIQLHGKETPAQAAHSAAHGLPVWKAIGVRKTADLDAARLSGLARILYDAKPPEGRPARRHGAAHRLGVDGGTSPSLAMASGGRAGPAQCGEAIAITARR